MLSEGNKGEKWQNNGDVAFQKLVFFVLFFFFLIVSFCCCSSLANCIFSKKIIFFLGSKIQKIGSIKSAFQFISSRMECKRQVLLIPNHKKLHHVPLANFKLSCSWPSHTTFSHTAHFEWEDAVLCGLSHFSRPPLERKLTSALIAVHGTWDEWSPWSLCSSTCGRGYRDRTRTCKPPQFGGNPCEGPEKQTKFCNIALCPGKAVRDWETSLQQVSWSPKMPTCGSLNSSVNVPPIDTDLFRSGSSVRKENIGGAT